MGTADLYGCYGLGVLDKAVGVSDANGDGDAKEQGYLLAFLGAEGVS